MIVQIIIENFTCLTACLTRSSALVNSRLTTQDLLACRNTSTASLAGDCGVNSFTASIAHV